MERERNQVQPEKEQETSLLDDEPYGWEFHKKPLLYALILTALFYAFIFFYISI